MVWGHSSKHTALVTTFEPSDFWYGVDCECCRLFVPLAQDDGTRENSPGVAVRSIPVTCPSCGCAADYPQKSVYRYELRGGR